jgi:hypothetical protein
MTGKQKLNGSLCWGLDCVKIKFVFYSLNAVFYYNTNLEHILSNLCIFYFSLIKGTRYLGA